MRTAIAFSFVLACGPAAPAQHVEIAPLPTPNGAIDSPHVEPDAACKPETLEPIDADASGALDTAALRRVLASSMAFAKRCCSGDEEEDAVVAVTVSPGGYSTEVSVTPESSGPTNACLYATFHRVITKSFSGDPITVRVPLHIKGD